MQIRSAISALALSVGMAGWSPAFADVAYISNTDYAGVAAGSTTTASKIAVSQDSDTDTETSLSTVTLTGVYANQNTNPSSGGTGSVAAPAPTYTLTGSATCTSKTCTQHAIETVYFGSKVGIPLSVRYTGTAGDTETVQTLWNNASSASFFFQGSTTTGPFSGAVSGYGEEYNATATWQKNKPEDVTYTTGSLISESKKPYSSTTGVVPGGEGAAGTGLGTGGSPNSAQYEFSSRSRGTVQIGYEGVVATNTNAGAYDVTLFDVTTDKTIATDDVAANANTGSLPLIKFNTGGTYELEIVSAGGTSAPDYLSTTGGASGTGSSYAEFDMNITSAPEASTWLMLSLGFAGVGYAGLRRGKGSRYAI
jgi:hypothetical protein